HQRGGVDELEYRREHHVAIARVAAQLSRKEKQDRPHALAPALGNVAAQLVDHAHFGAQMAAAFLLHLRQLVADQEHDLGQSWRQATDAAHGRGMGLRRAGPEARPRRLHSRGKVGHGPSTRTASAGSSFFPESSPAFFGPPGSVRVSMTFEPSIRYATPARP